MDDPNKFALMSVRGRLLLAFLGISMFSLVAAASGLYSLSQVGGALGKITEQRVPETLSWLELSRRVESVVGAAPPLLAVKTDSARIDVSNEIAVQIEQLEPFLQRKKSYEIKEEKEATDEVLRFVAAMTDNLERLNELVKKRLSIVAFETKRIRDLNKANSIAKRMLSPGERILGAQMADWKRLQETTEENSLSNEKSDLVNSIMSLIPQQRAALLVDSIHNDLLKITDADSAERVDVLIFPLKRSLEELYEVSLVITDMKKREEELTSKSNALEETNKRLKRAQEQISKYIDPHITEKIFKGEFLAELSHKRTKLTMFFSDIKDFTQFTDASDPEDVAMLLNEYLGDMAQIVRKWGGTIPQFTGDSIYAIFGAPDSKGEQGDALACLHMALEMQLKMKTLREKWWNQGIQFPFEIRCGIHTGMANVGNYGSEGFMEYSAIGLNTNLASRLEQACQPGEIYLSHTSWALVKNEIPCEEVGTIEVKGFHYPIQTYRVLQDDVERTPESSGGGRV